MRGGSSKSEGTDLGGLRGVDRCMWRDEPAVALCEGNECREV